MAEETKLDELESPHVVQEMLRLLDLRDNKDRRKVELDLKLSYYFGGYEVAYRETKKGLVIVASGSPADVGTFLDQLTPEKLESVHFLYPERWEVVLERFDTRERSLTR